jgi:isopentenyldiphosphate isomerase
MRTVADDEEILDLVDGFDTVIGTIPRSQYDRLISENLGYIRASELFMVNSKGELWTPVRTQTKKIAPGGFDYAAAGHVEAGEDYLSTLIRETNEELNLTITKEDIEFVAKIKSPSTRYIRSLYTLRTDKTPDYNPDDFVSGAWLTPEVLLQQINEGHAAKESLADSVEVLQAYLEQSKNLT